MAPNFLFKDEDFKTRQRFFYSRQITQNLLNEDFNKDGLDSSDSEEEIKPAKKQRRPNKCRDHLENHERLMKDYFNADAVYDTRDFTRRYRMEKGLFLRILQDLTDHYPYFVQKPVSLWFLSL
jgi:hypothetical protein